jgi:hypothetical protein
MTDLRGKMDEITKSIKPLITSKSEAPGYMFSASGKSFSKNCLTFDIKSKERKVQELNQILSHDIQKESFYPEYDSNAQGIDGFFSDCHNAHTDHKSKQNNKNQKKTDQSKIFKRPIQDPLAKLGGGNSIDDDRF